jgi:glycosyltransferase involved in cell wall biosynthesis
MRIAFYAPLRPPAHGASPGDHDGAGLLQEALARAGHAVQLASTFSSYDGEGDMDRQVALRDRAAALARQLAVQWRTRSRAAQPDLWFTYHVYYKAPDWLGPALSAEYGLPYVIAEASHAPKRAGGRWAIGHDAAADAIRAADLVLCNTRHDVLCVEPLVFNRERIVRLPPFLDPAPYRAAAESRESHRAALASAHQLDPGVPWIMVAATMTRGDKLESYRELAAALARLQDLSWRLVVAGNGPARFEVEGAIEAAAPDRACFLGDVASPELAAVHAACDLCVWPAINESYGEEMLRAQAAGTAVVSCALRGVPDVVAEGRAGLLARPGDPDALALCVRGLLTDPERRAAMGRAAITFVGGERSVDAAAARLGRALAKVTSSGAATI